MEGGIPEIPSVVAVFNVVADRIKHLLGRVNVPCIQNLVEGEGVRVEKVQIHYASHSIAFLR